MEVYRIAVKQMRIGPVLGTTIRYWNCENKTRGLVHHFEFARRNDGPRLDEDGDTWRTMRQLWKGANMRLRETFSQTSVPILWNAIRGVTCLVGASAIGAILLSRHGWIFTPLYVGGIWGWYFIEVKVREYRTFGVSRG